MADAAFFENAKLTDIWNPIGRDPNTGAMRYRRANFDVMTWVASPSNPPETYVVPLGMERTNSADINLKSDDGRQVGMEFGYYGGDSMVIDTNQGDGSDSVQGLHSFGPV